MKKLILRLRDLAAVQCWASDHFAEAADAIESQAATIALYETTAENYELLQAKVDEQAREIERLNRLVDGAYTVAAALMKELAALKAQPSGVVLPERKSWQRPFPPTDFERGHDYALDAVARLNSSPVSAALTSPAPGECVAVPVETLRGVLQYCDQLLGELNGMYQYSGSTGDDKTHEDQDYSAVRALLAQQGKAVGDE